MTWHAGDPGFPPSPDPAWEAELEFQRRDELDAAMGEDRTEEEEEVCANCGGGGALYRSDHHPMCRGEESDCARLCPVQVQVQCMCVSVKPRPRPDEDPEECPF